MGFTRKFSLRRKPPTVSNPRYHKGSLSGEVFQSQTPEEAAAAHRLRSKPFGSVDLTHYNPDTQGLGQRRVADVGEQRMSINPLRAHPHGLEDTSAAFVATPFPEESPSSSRQGLPIGIALGSPAHNNRKPSAQHTPGLYDKGPKTAPLGRFRDVEFHKPQSDERNQKHGRWGKLGDMLRKKESKPAFAFQNPPTPPPKPVFVKTAPREAVLPNFSSTSSEFAEQLRLELNVESIVETPKLSDDLPEEILFRPVTAMDSFIAEDDIPAPLNIPPKRAPTLDIDIPNTSMERYSVMFADVLKPNPRMSLLARRQATLDKRRSKRSLVESTFPPPPPQKDAKQRAGTNAARNYSSNQTKPQFTPRHASKDSRSIKQNAMGHSNSKDRRNTPAFQTSTRSNVQVLPPRLVTDSITPMPTVARYVQPAPLTPEEVPSLSVVASPTSTAETKSPETPGNRVIHHERSTSAPSIISPTRDTFGFDSLHAGEKNGQIMVIVHSPVEETSKQMSPIQLKTGIIKQNRISLTPTRLDFSGHDFFKDQNFQFDSSQGYVRAPEKQDQLQDQVSIARQISMRRRELLKPIVRRNEQLRQDGRNETERVADAKGLKPFLVDFDKPRSRNSQQALLEFV